MISTSDIREVGETISQAGLGCSLQDLSIDEQVNQCNGARGLLKEQYGVPKDVLIYAIRHGMRTLWPWRDNPGQPFTAIDVRKNITEAKAAYYTASQQGRLSLSPEELRREVEDMENA